MRTVLPLTLLLAACGQDQQAVGPVTWSDDDASQAYLFREFEQAVRESSFGRATRNHRFQIFVQAPDGSDRREVSPWFEGRVGTDFYYMRELGYLLVGWQDQPRGMRWDRVDLDGTVTTIHTMQDTDEPALPCVGGEILPSPSGEVLALIERAADGDCAEGVLRVRLIDAESLTETAMFERPMDRHPLSAFTREGELLFWTFGAGAWRIDPVEGIVELDYEPDCAWPRTSSSTLSDEGVRIGAGTVDEPVVVEATGVESCW